MRSRFCLILALSISFFFAQQAALAADGTFEKPIFVLVFDKTCHAWCGQVRPVVKELQQEYGDRIEFAELDVTQSALEEAKKTAKQMGLQRYISDFSDLVPLVAVFNTRRDLIKELVGPKRKEDYKKVVDAAMLK